MTEGAFWEGISAGRGGGRMVEVAGSTGEVDCSTWGGVGGISR